MSPAAARWSLFAVCLLFLEGLQVDGRRGFCTDAGGGEQDWGHVTVRPYAHMFWWLFYSTAPVSNYTQAPLIIWLQGGPGVPSSGYGVFSELGPLDVNLKERNHTWVKDFNMLFLDNPVGVGFSYFSNGSNRVCSNEEIADDLVAFIGIFLKEHPEFREVPTYIFGESYGGKMATEFAYQLHSRIKDGIIKCNLKGIGLGDSYISPIDYISFYAPIAFHLGLIDRTGYIEIEARVKTLKRLMHRKKYVEASDMENVITSVLVNYMSGVDLYNFLERTNATSADSFRKYEDVLNVLLNEQVKLALNLSKKMKWEFFSDDTYCDLKGDILQSVTERVESLLNNTDLKVIVYNGVLDILVNTAGTAKWLNNLNWKRSAEWLNTTQTGFTVNEVTEGYVKEVGNLVFYTVARAGHSVPIDNPTAMDYILTDIKTKYT